MAAAFALVPALFFLRLVKRSAVGWQGSSGLQGTAAGLQGTAAGLQGTAAGHQGTVAGSRTAAERTGSRIATHEGRIVGVS